ncbi:DUF6907 domain-containing protein [Streptomyces tibetensis]|uniref:DUF6907 domain-containing protein n=1 Tax=Streptomyces tibetensis TaxID=2382123 RepID=UPI0033E06E52
MSSNLPTFGPYEVQGGVDELEPAVAVVRVAFALTRTQLATVLGMSFAGLGADRTPESLTDDEVRREIEGQLAAEAIIEVDRQMERDQAQVFPPEQQRAMDVLAAGVDRAYARPEPPQHEIQQPRYGDGVVTLQTVDQGDVTVPEPAWCLGHDGEPVGHFADITHNGRPITADAVTAGHGQLEVAHGYITHAPHAVQQPEPHPVLYIALDLHASFDPEDGRHATRALRVAATRFDRALADLAHLRGESR